ncbi:MAG: YbaK/EbsC family protein [Acidobacteria bacterium]|nr:YbaK/EbsC family protein [Acidobacteriota bacterium]
MPTSRLKEFLDAHGVKYITIQHSQAYTAMELAQSAHLSGKEIAKTVIVDVDGKLAMAVLPATRKVDLEHLRAGTGTSRVELAHEGDFRFEFPGCEVGAMPPFGNLYDMDVFVDPHLAEDETIAFNAGTHTELVRMAYKDFERLVHPKAVAM